ncbi:hypothetical protein ACFQ38_14330 [Sporosarcina contaminans]|uniref:Chromosome segregation ATPase n=1 Tax=Sporosarcina contaminans TaxID=633403 RepID=A0ABW3U0L4_9BACL
MPAISKIRFTNVVYENGDKRYNDELFLFDGHDGAVVLENGGGKTVFIQTVLQAIIPHVEVAGRKMKKTLHLEDGPAHIAIEWILNERPRRYALTCVTLYVSKGKLDSLKYVHEYEPGSADRIEDLPFVHGKRPASLGEMEEYYQRMAGKHLNAHTFDTIGKYKQHLEEHFHIISSEWESIVKINGAEGDVERFFEQCNTSGQLVDRLLIPNIEDSMAGFESGRFAENFEARLDSFRQYKQFQEQLTEYRMIQHQVDTLARHFEQLDKRQNDYRMNQQKAKAFYEIGKQEHERYTRLSDELDVQLSSLLEQEKELRHREKSYDLAKERETLNALKEEHEIAKQALSYANSKVEETERRLIGLRLAEQNDAHSFAERQIVQYERELDAIDDDRTAINVLDDFAEVKRELADAFSRREEQLNKELAEAGLRFNQYERLATTEAKRLEGLKAELKDVELQEKGEETSIRLLQGDKERIRKELNLDGFDLPIETLIRQWTERSSELDELIVKTINRNTALKAFQEQKRALLEEKQDARVAAKSSLSETTSRLETLKEEEASLISNLQTITGSWTGLLSVHDRQDSIGNSLQDEMEQKRRRYEQFLLDERLANRLNDDYNGQSNFFADPFLNGQLRRLKHNFSYLKTGSEYVAASDQAAANSYPFWSTALITTGKDAPALIEQLERMRDDLYVPVNVLTLDEATELIRGGGHSSKDWIVPGHFESAVDPGYFEEWKETLKMKAEAVSTERNRFGSEIDQWKQLQSDFSRFIARYPASVKQSLEQKTARLQQLAFQLDRECVLIQKDLASYDHEQEANLAHITSWRDESKGIDGQLTSGRSFMEKKKQMQKHEEEKLQLQNKRATIASEIRRVSSTVKEFEHELESCKGERFRLKAALDKEVHSHHLYEMVKDERPLSCTLSIVALTERFHAAQRKVDGLQSKRADIENSLTSMKQKLAEANRQIEMLEHEYPGILADEFFPEDGQRQIRRLMSDLSQLKTSSKDVLKAETEKRDDFLRQSGVVEAKERDITDPVIFHEPLAIVQKQLQEEWSSFRQTNEATLQQKDAAKSKADNWLSLIRKLEKEAGEHQCLSSQVKAAILTEQERTDFLYQSGKIIDALLAGLDNSGRHYSKEVERVQKERDGYVNFCRSSISDARMQQTAVQGITSRETYEEVLAYKQLLEKSLHLAEQYANEHIQSHDKELELFLKHMMTHVSALRDELHLIPKKTAVKIEDKLKPIFRITVPEWTESDAKRLLRSHMNWILSQLERDAYQDEDGLDMAKIRKNLEKWLHSRQLLQVVLQNKQIRISCYKVTNDHKLSSIATSWEESNDWSGGEKWSKNMSLFLGLLNYIAEKKQHIQAHLKKHRTVILDNPFGKASSGHVLSPVFFIAEQLGFQLITLTAHAEGEFLSDYFPVVYSCRLRQVSGTSKQIVNPQKNIKKAYLRDFEPQTMERLIETEQMNLF